MVFKPMGHNMICDYPFDGSITCRIHQIHRISSTIGVGTDSVVLLGHRILAEPGRGPGIIEPGTEVQVGTAGGCRRGARKRACASLLACNFLATEPPAAGLLPGPGSSLPSCFSASYRKTHLADYQYIKHGPVLLLAHWISCNYLCVIRLYFSVSWPPQ